MADYSNLPTWEELCAVRLWVMSGCPVVHELDGRVMVGLLRKLIEGLPKHLAIYAYGTPEWRAELLRLGQLEEDEK